VVEEGVSKIALQRYSRCYCVTNVTKTLHLEAYELFVVQHFEHLIMVTVMMTMILNVAVGTKVF
jgi:hypothetical protein